MRVRGAAVAAWLILLWLSSAAWAQPTPGNTLVSPLVTGLMSMGTGVSEKIRLFDGGGAGTTSYGFGVSGGDLQSFLGGASNQFSWRGAGYNSTPVMTLSGTGTLAVTTLALASIADSVTAPTIASGGCTTGSAQSVSSNNGTGAFEITLGGATCGSTITLTLPAATTHWHCTADDITTPATNAVFQTAAASNTAVTLTNFVRTTGVAGNFTAADHLLVSCRGQ